MTDPLLWALIALQISLGAFDTLYHHELTERLAWRPSQAQELRLHAVRNGFYAVIFGVLGWAEPHGLWAWGLILLLAVEVGITLWDFVEEDLSRRLPATERVTHTLLALNYGAILVLAMPVLARWAGQETALIGAYYGPWSWLCAGAVVAVCVFGLRDWLAARRAPHLAEPDPAPLAAELNPRHILVTGATGFVGCRLVAALVGAGHRVTVLTRDPDKAAGLATPFTLVTDLDQIPSDARIDAIVNLAGESVAGGLWTQAKRDRIIGSRVAMAEALDRLVARLKVKPASFISASAIGWYGPRDARPVDEGVKPCPSFSHVSCAIAELAADAIGRHGLRVVNLRIGLVLASEGGLLARLLTPFEFGLGGPIGQGRQMMSWIHRDDLVRAILHCIEEESLRGPVNATAPHPVSNAAFARGLGQALGRPALLPMPAPALRLLGGDMARELLLSGQAVLPTKLTGSGFRFRHATPRVGPRRNPTRAPSPNSATSPRGESCKHHTHVTKMSAIAPISLWITWAEQPPATRGADGSFPGQRDQAGAAKGPWREELLRHLERLRPGAPICAMVHGYRFTWRGADAAADPHRRLFGVVPSDCTGPRPDRAAWAGGLGFTEEGTTDGLAIAFGWEARSFSSTGHPRSFGQIYRDAARAGRALCHLLQAIAEVRPSAEIDLFAHSLGARVALSAVTPGLPLGRLILLAAAEIVPAAEEALARAPGAQIYHILSRANDPFDQAFALAGPAGTSLGQAGLGRNAAGWLDLQLDLPELAGWMAARGHRLTRRETVSHWHFYTDRGAMSFYRSLLRQRAATGIGALLADGLPTQLEPRWARLRSTMGRIGRGGGFGPQAAPLPNGGMERI